MFADDAGLVTIVAGTKPMWEVEVRSGNAEIIESVLKRGRGEDDCACLNVDPRLAVRGAVACGAFADMSTSNNANIVS